MTLAPLRRTAALVAALALGATVGGCSTSEDSATGSKGYIAGDGEMSTQLRKLASVLGVADRVIFLGALDRESLRRHMVAADALVGLDEVEVTLEATAALVELPPS